MRRFGVHAKATVIAGVSVILVGALVIDGVLDELTHGGDAEAELITAATWEIVALTTATALAVYKTRPAPAPSRPMSPRPQIRLPREAAERSCRCQN